MKKAGLSILRLLGILLILCSLLLVGMEQIRNRIAAEQTEKAVEQLECYLPEQRMPGLPGTYRDSEMPVLELDGVDYVALLEIPAYNVKLPVANQWAESKRLMIPGRFWGSVYEAPCVIGGRDLDGQFDFCDRIELGTLVTVTDLTGAQFTYTVARVDRAGHAQTQWLLKEEFDLTLFCRGAYSMDYLAVRCVSTAR